MSIQNFIRSVSEDYSFRGDIRHHELLPPWSAKYGELTPPLPQQLRDGLTRQQVDRLYSHQAEAIQYARSGENVVVVTPTASGKTLVYALPILERLIRRDKFRALFLFPLKALAQDQLKRINRLSAELGFSEPPAAIIDGDTPKNIRTKLKRNPPPILMTNPDMLHYGLLPFHAQWSTYFKDLRFVVIDEIHTYKGIFGSHVLQVIKRLNRIASFYHAEPQYIATSATIGNPDHLACELTGRSFRLVDRSGAPAAGRHVLFINPTGSVYTTAVRLFTAAMEAGLKTIVFTKARKITELIHQWTVQSNPDLAGKVSAYRAGYLADERREIEKGLKTGTLKGVVSTSALEMGIDIGGLDVCILVGYPGTITTTWQRAGRVGRGSEESVVFLLAQQDALDQYYMRNPADFFGRSAEEAVVDAGNSYLLKQHLLCAAQEVPIRQSETAYDIKSLRPIIEELITEGGLVEAAAGTVWFSRKKNPHREVNIRGAGDTYPIIDRESRKLIGHVNGLQAMTECHPGAVYLHQGKNYIVEKLDLGKKEVLVSHREVDYYTMARTEKETEILEVQDQREMEHYRVSLGLLKVTERVVGYERRSTTGRERLDEHELDLPAVTYKTVGIWIQPDAAATDGLSGMKLHVMGSLHAMEHASLALLPIFALCDRNDVGGISFTMHTQLKTAAVFLYDGHPGGVGLAVKAFEVLDELLNKVRKLVEECPCEDGCPSCIHSPKCGHGNIPLDKEGCVALLKHLTGIEELKPGEVALPAALERAGSEENNKPGSTGRNENMQKKPVSSPRQSRYRSKLPLLENRDVVVFDIETQLSADEVGGWHNAHLMRVSLGVLYERLTGTYRTYLEDDVPRMVERMQAAEMVVGFNSMRFDHAVLSAYTTGDLLALPNLDILFEIHSCHGFRISLDALGAATLKAPKSADGLVALQWWKEGKIDEIEKYCRMDVEITTRLLEFALEKGYLLYSRRPHGNVRLPLDLPVERFFPRNSDG